MAEQDATVTCASGSAEVPARRGLFGRRKLPGHCAACGATLTGEVSFLGQALTDGEGSGMPTADPSPPVAPPSAAGAGATELQTQVVLTDPGKRKIAVIKAVRSATSLGLAEAKRLVDDTPSVLGTFSPPAATALVRVITDAGLAEAKRLVDGAPSVLGAFDPEAAVRAAERIEAAGGKYSLRVRA